MFKKPLGKLKTSSPLRNSDRKKLKQRVIFTFSLPEDFDADSLVPEGILSIKFSTHLNELGVAYLAPDGDPLWFTIGKGSDDLIPSVYTLWKAPKLLPFLSTPKAVIPILVGGADLMIPGVVHHTIPLHEGQLVSICKYERRADGIPTLSPPLAVGRMAVSNDGLGEGGDEKGKAVYLFHAWKDHLWAMGSKGEPPEDVPILANDEQTANEGEQPDDEEQQAVDDTVGDVAEAVEKLTTNDEQPSSSTSAPIYSYTPEEVTTILRKSLLQALSTSLSQTPLPIPASTLYTGHILPARPNFPSLVLLPSSASEAGVDPKEINVDPKDITIKSSSHKSLSSFLKSVEKLGLITTKSPKNSDVLTTAINSGHPAVLEHMKHVTVGEVESKAASKAKREEKAQQDKEKAKDTLVISELLKPHGASVVVCEAIGASQSNLYTVSEVRDLLDAYIAAKDLVNKHEKAYINLDPVLASCVSSKSQGKKKEKVEDPVPSAETSVRRGKKKAAVEEKPEMDEAGFIRRDELIKKVIEKMQNWYSVSGGVDDLEDIPKKGTIHPINVTSKIRQGRKACTLITGFEAFGIDAEEMAEELRRACSGATSISPIPGKPAGTGMEVLVQGKQAPAVTEYLMGKKGVPKIWIQVVNLTGKK